MFTLGEAAKEVGKSKTTLTRAINAGRLSGNRLDDGSYEIDPSELFRVYDAAEQSDPSDTPSHSATDETVTRLHSEIDDLKRRLAQAEDDRRQAEDDRRNEITRVTALLTHEQESRTQASDRLARERDQVTTMSRELGQLQEKIKTAEQGRAAAENHIQKIQQAKQPKRWSLFG